MPEKKSPPTLHRWNGDTGGIAGQITWLGEPPKAPMIETFRPEPGGRAERISRPAPNVPAVDPKSHGVANVLVYIREVTQTARDWDHAPVTLELNDERPMIRQGAHGPCSMGLVRCGDDITVVNKQDRFHAARVRGAAFWTFTLPDADRPITKRLDQRGIVELSSAAGYYWMHAYLFVCEHPYCAVTNTTGEFEILKVPPGDYELVTWMPSWEVIRRERDPESTAVVRVAFSKHHEWRQRTAVRPNQTANVAITVPQ
jgi:hypothetical protein